MSGLENVQSVFPLSPLQEGMLYHSISAPHSGVFVTQICVTLTGTLDPDQLRRTWRSVVARHDALRTAFLWDGLDAPLQIVREQVDLPWQVLDWRERDEDAFTEFLAVDRTQSFDLTLAPPMRLTLLRWSENQWRLLWSFHHVMIDGWSANLVLLEVLTRFGGRPWQRPSAGYKAFVDRALSSADEPQRFWSSRLAQRAEPTRLHDPLVRSQTGHARCRHGLTTALTEKLAAFARDARVTLNTVVLGAWARLLGTYADDDRPLFGVTVTTRPHDLPDIEDAIGVYINTLPLSVALDDRPLIDWLRAIQAEQQAMSDHALTPLTELQRLSGIPPGSPMFDSIVVFENHAQAADGFEDALTGTGLRAQISGFLDQSNYPLALLAIPGQELIFELVHDRSRLGEAFAHRMLRVLASLLESFVEHPERSVVRHALATPPERAPSGRSEHLPALHDRISRHASPHPALRYQGDALSYTDLVRQSDGVASQLAALGVGQGERVGLYARRGPAFVTGMLGIMKCGAAFVPLDPDYPAALNEEAARGTSLRLVLVDPDLAPEASSLCDTVIPIDGHHAEAAVRNVAAPDPAYIVHTSGSQGRRKGVVVTHGNISYSTHARQEVYGAPPQRFLLLSPVAFDSAMVGLFWTLSEGGTLVLPEPGQERDVNAIANLIAAESVTHLLCIPSLYSLLLEFAPPGALDSLDTAIVAGEACPPNVVAQHFRTLPSARLFNEYGPTEATVWCLAAQLRPEDAEGPVPIGTPIPGTQAYLLDRWDHPVPEGVTGELFVAGPGVAHGYLDMPEETAGRFRPAPLGDGRMYRTGDLAVRRAAGDFLYLGRVDEQIKLNGYRIEPAEIAGRLSEHAEVVEAYAVLQGPPPPDATLEQLIDALPRDAAERLLTDIENMADADVSAALEEV